MMPTKTAPLFPVYGLAASLGPKSHLFTTHKTHYGRELEVSLSLSRALSRDALAPSVIIVLLRRRGGDDAEDPTVVLDAAVWKLQK
jgi:hypothetical protein